MKNLTIIEQRDLLGKEFKIYGDFENPLFLARDVASWIDYSEGNESHMLSMIDESEKVKIFCTITEGDNGTKPDIIKGSANRMFLTEEGLYEVLMQSRKPIAKEFKKEVKIILKSIRKHGAYITSETLQNMMSSPDFAITLFTKIKEEQEQRKIAEEKNQLLESKIEKMTPKITYCDLVLQSTELLTTTTIAKDYGMSAVKFNQILHELVIQYKAGKSWYLYQNYCNFGYTQSKTFTLEKVTTTQTYWTQKGRFFLYNKLKKIGILPSIEKFGDELHVNMMPEIISMKN